MQQWRYVREDADYIASSAGALCANSKYCDIRRSIHLILYAKFEIISTHETKNNVSGETAHPNYVLVATSFPSVLLESDFFKFCQ